MTNAEKFENVFGFKPNSNLCYAPEDVECPQDCDDCQYISWLNDEYVAESKKADVIDKIRAEINSQNRGTCDYFIVDRIEEIIDKYITEIGVKSCQEKKQ